MNVYKCLTMAAVLAATGAWPGAASAANEQLAGLVTRIYPTGAEVYFRINSGCKITPYWYFSMDSAMGKASYAMLLAAAHNKTPIRFSFPGPCSATINQQINYLYQDF